MSLNLEQFFKIDVTNADLRSFGNISFLSNRLIICETTGTITSIQYERSLNGTRSERQVDFDD